MFWWVRRGCQSCKRVLEGEGVDRRRFAGLFSERREKWKHRHAAAIPRSAPARVQTEGERDDGARSGDGDATTPRLLVSVRQPGSWRDAFDRSDDLRNDQLVFHQTAADFFIATTVGFLDKVGRNGRLPP